MRRPIRGAFLYIGEEYQPPYHEMLLAFSFLFPICLFQIKYFTSGSCNACPQRASACLAGNGVLWLCTFQYEYLLQYGVGDGGRVSEMFNPSALDCRQWARVCKDAGMKGIILTAKHHDGFCLFKTEQTDFQSLNAPCSRDLIGELAEA